MLILCSFLLKHYNLTPYVNPVFILYMTLIDLCYNLVCISPFSCACFLPLAGMSQDDGVCFVLSMKN